MLPMTPVGKPLSRCSLISQRGAIGKQSEPVHDSCGKTMISNPKGVGRGWLEKFPNKSRYVCGGTIIIQKSHQSLTIRPALPLPLPLPLGLPSNIHLPRMPPLLRFLLILSFLDSFDLLPRLPRVRLASPPYPVIDDL